MLLRYCLGIDVAAMDSMYCLISEAGEIIFTPEKHPHTLTGFMDVISKFENIPQEQISIIMESTSTYHLKVERFFRENTDCEIIILNPIISNRHKRNLRKTKTDKEDCLNLIDVFFKNEYNMQVHHEEIYSEMQFLSRQIQHLQEGTTRTRNRFRQLVSMLNPAYIEVFRSDYMYSETALSFIAKWPHCDMLKEASVDEIAKSLASTRQRFSSYYTKKAEQLKAYALDCYPTTDKNSVMTTCLSETTLYLLSQLKEIDVLKERLISLAQSTELYEIYVSIPGIGPYLASTLIAELKDIRRFENHKKLTAYCGFDPTIIQSGKSVHYNGPISKRGNSTARKMLFYTVNIILTVARKTNREMPLLLYYEKKRGEGKHHHACIVACCTKLLRILLAMSKQNILYH